MGEAPCPAAPPPAPTAALQMWRERSLAPLFASGPEWLWREVAWTQGASNDGAATRAIGTAYNVPAFMRHAWQALQGAQDGLFDRVFDYDAVKRTLWRNCTINLLALRKYGTVEFRRMHATLDSDFVVAWARFCVAYAPSPSLF